MKEPVVVEKCASNVDILPTLSNLFGLEYDSRMMVGKDILSDGEPLVVFSNRSWINGKGRYNAVTLQFESFDGVFFADEDEEHRYINRINAQVENRFQISSLILTNDYYSKVLPK